MRRLLTTVALGLLEALVTVLLRMVIDQGTSRTVAQRLLKYAEEYVEGTRTPVDDAMTKPLFAELHKLIDLPGEEERSSLQRTTAAPG